MNNCKLLLALLEYHHHRTLIGLMINHIKAFDLAENFSVETPGKCIKDACLPGPIGVGHTRDLVLTRNENDPLLIEWDLVAPKKCHKIDNFELDKRDHARILRP